MEPITPIRKIHPMESFKKYLTESTKFYRGHAKGADPMKSNRKGILWVTPSRELAASYGEVVSEVKFTIRGHKIANLGEINRTGTVKDILDAKRPYSPESEKRYKEAMYHFGGGKQRMLLPKFLHKIGSDKVIAYFQSLNVTLLQAHEDGIITYGIIGK